MATKLGDKCGRQGRMGDYSEEWTRRFLKGEGYSLIPLSLIENGGAPLLESDVDPEEILPDILACGPKPPFLVDVKSKTSSTPNRNHGRLETGIALRHYESYQAVARRLGVRIALFFLHARQAEGLLGFLDEIGEDARIWTWNREWAMEHPGHAFKESMIFFNVDPAQGSRFEAWHIQDDPLWLKFRAEAGSAIDVLFQRLRKKHHAYYFDKPGRLHGASWSNKCPRCDGSGRAPTPYAGYIRCGLCNGAGLVQKGAGR